MATSLRAINVTITYLVLQRAGVLLTQVEQNAVFSTIRLGFILALFIPAAYLGKFRLILLSAAIVIFGYNHDLLFSLGYLCASASISLTNLAVKEYSNQSHIQASLGRVGQVGGYFAAGAMAAFISRKSELNILLSIYLIFILAALQQFKVTKPKVSNSGCLEMVGSAILGFVTGIRTLSVYVLLPRYLIDELGHLPWWFGLELSLYAIMVGLSQIPVLYKGFKPPFLASLGILGFSFVSLFSPRFFNCASFVGCAIWLAILALEEGFASGIDVRVGLAKGTFWREFGFGLSGIALNFFLEPGCESFSVSFLLALTAIGGFLLKGAFGPRI